MLEFGKSTNGFAEPITKLKFDYFQNEITQHQTSCIKREVICPRFDCDEKFQFFNIQRHFDNHWDHERIPDGPSHLKKGVFKFDEAKDHYFEEWKSAKISPVSFQADLKDGLFLVFRDQSTKIWHFYVSLGVSKANAANYRSIICITASNGVSFFRVSTSGYSEPSVIKV